MVVSRCLVSTIPTMALGTEFGSGGHKAHLMSEKYSLVGWILDYSCWVLPLGRIFQGLEHWMYSVQMAWLLAWLIWIALKPVGWK